MRLEPSAAKSGAHRELLTFGEVLNSETQAGGYVYDDIRRVIESYTETPYSGMPDEAFRHFPLTAGIPDCVPVTGDEPRAVDQMGLGHTGREPPG